MLAVQAGDCQLSLFVTAVCCLPLLTLIFSGRHEIGQPTTLGRTLGSYLLQFALFASYIADILHTPVTVTTSAKDRINRGAFYALVFILGLRVAVITCMLLPNQFLFCRSPLVRYTHSKSLALRKSISVALSNSLLP